MSSLEAFHRSHEGNASMVVLSVCGVWCPFCQAWRLHVWAADTADVPGRQVYYTAETELGPFDGVPQLLDVTMTHLRAALSAPAGPWSKPTTTDVDQ